MIYSDFDLRDLIAKKRIPESSWIGPSSVDLTLSDSFSYFRDGVQPIDPREEDPSSEMVELSMSSIVISSGEFLLASTREEVSIPEDCSAYVEGRSSIGRIGIQVQNAGFIDAGFQGQITLELYNQSNRGVILREGMRICQLVLMRMTSHCERPYSGKYQNQKNATPSRIHLDENIS